MTVKKIDCPECQGRGNLPPHTRKDVTIQSSIPLSKLQKCPRCGGSGRLYQVTVEIRSPFGDLEQLIADLNIREKNTKEAE